jgi:hypothetical protein
MSPLITRHSAVLLLSLAVGGCFNTYHIPPAELARLDGLSPSHPVEVIDDAGELVRVTTDSQLTLQAPAAPPVVGKFTSITVSGNLLTGMHPLAAEPVLQNLQRPTPQVRLDLATLQPAQVRNYSPGKTTGLALGIAVPISLALGLLGAFAVLVSATH